MLASRAHVSPTTAAPVTTLALHRGLMLQKSGVGLRSPCLVHQRAPLSQRWSVQAGSESAAPAAASETQRLYDTPASTTIIGGGPCGLAAAMYLSDMGWRDIEVWDKRSRPRPSNDGIWGTGDRSYNIGITATGREALRELGVYDRVLTHSAPITFRQEWNPQNPDGKRSSALGPGNEEPTQAIQRDRLVACMLEHIEEVHAGRVRVRHNMQLQELAVQPGGKVAVQWSQADSSGDGTATSIQGSTANQGVAQTDFLVGADGANSVVRTLLEEQGLGEVRSVNLEEKPENTRVYKTIVIPLQNTEYSAADGSAVCTLSERSEAGRILDSLPTKEGNLLALALFKAQDLEASAVSTEEEADEFLKSEFPNMYPLIPSSEIKAFAERPLGKLPTFQYVWPKLHYSDCVVLAGDAIHTVKPYFGLGLNTALDDVRWLSQCLQKHQDDRAAALALYSKERALDSQAFVVESHKADQGFWQFVFPIMMDSFFNKLFPGLFADSMVKLMIRGDARYAEVRRRKRFAWVNTTAAYDPFY